MVISPCFFHMSEMIFSNHMLHGRKHINNHIRRNRKMMGYLTKDIAWLLEIRCADRVSRWERGLAMPSVTNLLKLALLFRTLPDQLYGEYRNELRLSLSKREKLLQAMKNKVHEETN
jgi:transcriptional regulator with XRE-family HTH domain